MLFAFTCKSPNNLCNDVGTILDILCIRRHLHIFYRHWPHFWSLIYNDSGNFRCCGCTNGKMKIIIFEFNLEEMKNCWEIEFLRDVFLLVDVLWFDRENLWNLKKKVWGKFLFGCSALDCYLSVVKLFIYILKVSSWNKFNLWIKKWSLD